jgi:hypothetical protein
MERPKNRLAPVLAIVLIMLGAYVVRYLTCGVLVRGPQRYRIVSAKWEAVLFKPAEVVESQIRGTRVRCGWREPWRDSGVHLSGP